MRNKIGTMPKSRAQYKDKTPKTRNKGEATTYRPGGR